MIITEPAAEGGPRKKSWISLKTQRLNIVKNVKSETVKTFGFSPISKPSKKSPIFLQSPNRRKKERFLSNFQTVEKKNDFLKYKKVSNRRKKVS